MTKWKDLLMNSDQGERETYVEKVREGMRQYFNELMAENEKLRMLVAKLENEKAGLEDDLSVLREELTTRESREATLEQKLASIEAETRRFSEKYLEVERHHANLANLYVATYRLHSTLDRQEVLSTIQEIIINLIGSEELAIFEMGSEGQALNLVSFFGVEPEYYKQIPLGSGLIGRAALTGQTYHAEAAAGNGKVHDNHLTSCIPLKVDGKVTGAIAIFRLLQQKPSLQDVDYELFHLLATHGATALYCSKN
jgi:hypothetical protein